MTATSTSLSLAGRDVLSISDLTRAEIEAVLAQAEIYQRGERQSPHAAAHGRLLAGYVLATVFYEPSTRTRLSFESAMARLGGHVISVAEARSSSSAAKGETLADTGRMLAAYADVIAMRHPAVGSAREVAQAAGVPVLNGGDGTGEHPTQALLDLYTIRQEKSTLDGLTIGLVGDLKNGRTVHSLARALSHWDVQIVCIAPPALAMPAEVLDAVGARGRAVRTTGDLAAAARECDVLYITRVQKERFADPADYEALKGSYVVNRALVSAAKNGVTIMHPLPRVDEIATDVDDLPGAAYFRQAANGVAVRMALLAMVLGKV
jgi:aspartate carbamoyltransferase